MRSAALLAALVLMPVPAAFAAAAPIDDGATPIEVTVGETVALCERQLVHCPVSTFLCDDPKVALVRHGPAGAELKGISPGTTLCSVTGAQGAFRRMLRVSVKSTAAPRAP
jgi:hypothetical protein